MIHRSRLNTVRINYAPLALSRRRTLDALSTIRLETRGKRAPADSAKEAPTTQLGTLLLRD